MTRPLSAAGREPVVRVVDQRGRAKAFRPLPAAERRAALARGLAAYARGDFYLAHEELEPAWMGADDPGERELLAGLIKLAAGFVHAARGNAAGVQTNLAGASERLAAATALGTDLGLDIPGLRASVESLLECLAALPIGPAGQVPDPAHDVAGPPGRARRPPLALDPPAVVRRTVT